MTRRTLSPSALLAHPLFAFLQRRSPIGAALMGLFVGLCFSSPTLLAQSTNTGSTGSGTAVDNNQPTTALRWVIVTQGVFPNRGSGPTGTAENSPFLGEIRALATTGASINNTFEAQGQLVSISSNSALFSILGTTYGGDGRTTFGMPDLRGRAAVHQGTGTGLTNRRLGSRFGTEANTLSVANLPSHRHTINGGSTDAAGSGSAVIAVSNTQPSLTVAALVQLTGTDAGVGAIRFFGGNFAPQGFAFADGTLLAIVNYPTLFGKIGTTYGGDGTTTFALPDLRGRTIVGTGTGDGLSAISLGQTGGSETFTLAENQMPAHTHSYTGGTTGSAGGSATTGNAQPYLGLTAAVARTGTHGEIGAMDSAGVGELRFFAHTNLPAANSWTVADGAMLPTNQNQALFSLMGTSFGGDGTPTFALPDMRGRANAGRGQGSGLTSRSLGHEWGTENVSLAVANLPAHTHTYTPANSAPTDITLGNTSFNQSPGVNHQFAAINVTDPDSADTHTRTLVAGDGDTSNSLFNIDQGFLRVNDTRNTPAGSHRVRIQVEDSAGNTFSKSFTVTAVDNLGPDAPTIVLNSASDSGTAGDNRTNANRPTFDLTAEAGSTVRFYNSADDATTLATAVVPSSGKVSITLATALADGQYAFSATATDTAGNTGLDGSIARSVIIDTAPPVITSATELTVTYGDAVSYRTTASGFPATFLAPAGVPTGLSYDGTGLLTGTASSVGTQTINFATADDVGNAVLSTLTLTVNPRQVSFATLTVLSKNYDGDNTAELRTDNLSLGNIIDGDDVSLDFSNATAAFESALIGSPKNATVTGLALTGSDAANYTLPSPITTSVPNGIQRGTLTVTGITAIDRVYNATNTVALDFSGATLTGLVAGEDVSIDQASSSGFLRVGRLMGGSNAAPVGMNQSVSVSISITGDDRDNYFSVRNSDAVTVNITPAPLTVTGITAEDKIADGTTNATIDVSNAVLNGVIEFVSSPDEGDGLSAALPQTSGMVSSSTPDDVQLDTSSATGTFATAAAGDNITVTIDGLSLTGISAGNYTLTNPTTRASITSASQPQTITFDGPADKLSNDAAFTLEATASSELPVTFTVVSGPALLEGTTLTLTGATGTVTVRADQAGSDEWDPATPVTRTFEVTQVGPLVYFGTTTDGTEFAVNIPEGRTTGTLFGSIASTGQFYILTFQINSDNTITALNLTIFGDATSAAANLVANPLREQVGRQSSKQPLGPPEAARDNELTFTGTLLGGALTFQIAELGITLNGTVEPPDGPSANLAGLYESSSLNSASGTTTSIVGTTGRVFVLAITPNLVTGGSGQIATNGTFTLQTNASVTITGNVDAPSTTVTGTIVLPDGSEDAFAGLSTDTLRTDRLINLSTRARIDSANGDILITGFVVGGPEPKQLLLRAVGPTLADFGINAALEDPRIVIYDATGTAIAQNDNWGGDSATAGIISRTGAFALPAESTDAVIVTSLDPGPYTMHVVNAGAAGIAIAEIYDAAENPNSQYQRLINISSRGNVTGGEGVLVGGFVVTGNSPKRMLIRGVGPTLADFGLSAALADPQLKVYNSDQQVIARNNDWATADPVFASQRTATAAEIVTATTTVGGFALGDASADAALIVTLQPGAYTVEISSTDDTSGNALIEVYEIPENE